MKTNELKKVNLALRKGRVRSKVSGSADRPRLSIRVSNRHIHTQVIDDTKSATLVSASTVGLKSKEALSEQASKLGSDLAAKLKKAKISRVVLDRNGKKYHGRIKALAESLRKEGVEV
jgi:large subunit ribosomal protein L18